MPKRLPNGVLICNVTPHPLPFWCGEEYKVIEVGSDGVVNALPVITEVSKGVGYTLTTVNYIPSPSSEVFLSLLRERYPDALIVGSIIAAQAYREKIFAPVPLKRERHMYKINRRLVHSDVFTVFPKEQ